MEFRKISSNGTSLQVVLPPLMLKQLNAVKGTYFQIELHKDKALLLTPIGTTASKYIKAHEKGESSNAEEL